MSVFKKWQEGGRRRSRIVVSWGPREESVSRREQLLIPHVHIATAESCFYLRFLPVLVHMYVFFFSLPPSPPLGHMFTSEWFCTDLFTASSSWAPFFRIIIGRIQIEESGECWFQWSVFLHYFVTMYPTKAEQKVHMSCERERRGLISDQRPELLHLLSLDQLHCAYPRGQWHSTLVTTECDGTCIQRFLIANQRAYY